MTEIACVIPARFNSSRFPGKLLKTAGGRTVLQRTWEQASSCPEIDALFVATDHEEIANHILHLGGRVIWTDPSCQNGTERICEALQKEDALQKSSLIVNLQGDHPTTSPSTLTAIIRALKEDEKAVMSTAATPIKSLGDYLSPHTVKVVFDRFFNALYFSRSPIPFTKQDAELSAYAHIGVYCYKTPFLKKFFDKKTSSLQNSEDLEQLKVLENGHLIKIAVVEETILGVDTPKDLEKLEEFLCR